MELQNEKDTASYSQKEDTNSVDTTTQNEKLEAETEDTDPPLDEEDLDEIGLSVEDSDQIEWEAPEKGSSGLEEKDITD